MKNVSALCIICDEEKEHGIRIFSLFICAVCEQNMRLTEPEDENYHYYIEKLKKVTVPKSS